MAAHELFGDALGLGVDGMARRDLGGAAPVRADPRVGIVAQHAPRARARLHARDFSRSLSPRVRADRAGLLADALRQRGHPGAQLARAAAHAALDVRPAHVLADVERAGLRVLLGGWL